MELNARMICILQEVIEAQDTVTVDQICSRNDISKRTFYYDIKNVNAWLREKQLPEIVLRSGSCTIDASVGDALTDIIRRSDTEYFMSVDERKIMMAMYIGLAGRRVRIHDFCELFDISKNTVLSDMKSIRKELSERHIGLRFETDRGYYFQGNEYAVRNYLYGQFKKVRDMVQSIVFVPENIDGMMTLQNGVQTTVRYRVMPEAVATALATSYAGTLSFIGEEVAITRGIATASIAINSVANEGNGRLALTITPKGMTADRGYAFALVMNDGSSMYSTAYTSAFYAIPPVAIGIAADELLAGKGNVAVPVLGEPAVVRAWLATEEVEQPEKGRLPDPHVAGWIGQCGEWIRQMLDRA